MGLNLYNTLTRTREPFVPIDADNVRMYVCGPTVYDFAHIGNARPVVVFDILYRVLKTLYPKVTYARNITDVDDKIIAAAHDNAETITQLTRRTEDAFHDDMAALNALDPDIEPRATEHIEEMIDLVANLIERGHAYEADGHVLFSVASMEGYGALSKRSRDELIVGARVEVAPYKRDPADFILWKPSIDDQPAWPSPWGRGRPGWHLECSAMSEKHLGQTFDIHGGGLDLIFPHHENEIAQSVCAHDGAPFVKYWVHNGFLMVEGEKMSKSLGNFYTVHDLRDEFPGEAIRLALLQTHYRQPMDFTKAGVARAKRDLDKFYTALSRSSHVPATSAAAPKALWQALFDDLNTPLAISKLHDLANRLNKAVIDAEKAILRGALLAGGAALGLLGEDPAVWFKGNDADGKLDEPEIERRIAARKAARENRDFGAADAIRDELAERGIVLEDGPDGTGWKRL